PSLAPVKPSSRSQSSRYTYGATALRLCCFPLIRTVGESMVCDSSLLDCIGPDRRSGCLMYAPRYASNRVRSGVRVTPIRDAYIGMPSQSNSERAVRHGVSFPYHEILSLESRAKLPGDDSLDLFVTKCHTGQVPKILGSSLAEHREQVRGKLFAALSELMEANGFDAVSMAD